MARIDAIRFGEKLKTFRDQQGLSQEALRERLCENEIEVKDKSTISKWEHGISVPNRDVVEALDYILCTDGILLSLFTELTRGVFK